MVRFFHLLVLAALTFSAAAQETRVAVSVFDEKTGQPANDLNASNFAVVDGTTTLQIVAAEYVEGILDIMLIADTSIVGNSAKPVVGALIDVLTEQNQVALVGYDQAATLLQDFSNSKEALYSALESARYGNNPRVLDALYAVLDEGFESSAGRLIALVVAGGVEGESRSSLADVFDLARRRAVEIHCVYMENIDGSLFERLAERAAGSWFSAKKLKLPHGELAKVVAANLRGRYELRLTGVYRLGPRVEVELVGVPKSRGKLIATVLSLD
jgi:hypothetical protein